MARVRTASQVGRWKRNKGKAHERAVAEALRPVYPKAQRGIGQARAAGEVPDVTGTPWWVEAKHHTAAPNVHKAFAQGLAARGATDGRPVLVVSRKSGEPDLATVSLAVFVGLMSELEALRKAFDVEVEK